MQSKIHSTSDLWSIYVGKDHFANLLSATGLPKDAFLSHYIPVAEKLTSCVQDLPLTPAVFRGLGGALQCGLQSGLLALRLCDSQIFEPTATAQERQKNDPLWRWLAYCASLATVYLICAGNVRVLLNENYFSFAQDTPLGKHKGSFEASWDKTSTQTNEAGLIYLHNFFHPGQFADFSPALLNALAGAINPAMTTSPHETPLARIVRMAITQVIDAQKKRDGKIIEPTPSSEYVDVQPVAPNQTQVKPDPLKPVQVAPASSPAAPPAAEPSSTITLQAPAQPPATNHRDVLPVKLSEWIKALAHIRSMDAEIQTDSKTIRIGRKALNFGALARENYEALYEAKVVVEKGADFALCNEKLLAVYLAEKAIAIKK